MTMFDGNPYSVQQYQLPNGNVVQLTALQAQQIFGPGPNAQQNVQPQGTSSAQQVAPPAQSPITPRQSMSGGINGRVVNSHEEIVPNEIPMNGEFCYFPSSDGSTIYAKRWDSNGNIQNETFVRQIQDLPNLGSNGNRVEGEDYISRIMEQLNAIEAKIDRQRPYKKPYYNKNKPNNQPKPNKEV